MVIAAVNMRQSAPYVMEGIAMNESEESIVAKIETPAAHHGIRPPPFMKSSAPFSRRMKNTPSISMPIRYKASTPQLSAPNDGLSSIEKMYPAGVRTPGMISPPVMR